MWSGSKELASPQVTTPTFLCHGRQTCSTIILLLLPGRFEGRPFSKYLNMHLPAFLPEVKSWAETAAISLPDDWHSLSCGSSESACTVQVCTQMYICTHHCRGYLKSPSSAPTLYPHLMGMYWEPFLEKSQIGNIPQVFISKGSTPNEVIHLGPLVNDSMSMLPRSWLH